MPSKLLKSPVARSVPTGLRPRDADEDGAVTDFNDTMRHETMQTTSESLPNTPLEPISPQMSKQAHEPDPTTTMDAIADVQDTRPQAGRAVVNQHLNPPTPFAPSESYVAIPTPNEPQDKVNDICDPLETVLVIEQRQERLRNSWVEIFLEGVYEREQYMYFRRPSKLILGLNRAMLI